MTGHGCRRATINAVKFLSDEWIAALNEAAARRNLSQVENGGDGTGRDPLHGVSIVIEQSVEGVTRWRMIIDDGRITVRRSGDGDGVADVRLTCTEEIARAIAAGQRPPLDAFINGELRIGGDVTLLLTHRAALESMGDLFATVRDRTTFG